MICPLNFYGRAINAPQDQYYSECLDLSASRFCDRTFTTSYSVHEKSS